MFCYIPHGVIDNNKPITFTITRDVIMAATSPFVPKRKRKKKKFKYQQCILCANGRVKKINHYKYE